MVGRDVQEILSLGSRGMGQDQEQDSRPPVLSVRSLWLAHPKPTAGRPRLVDGVSFDVGRGEVLGLAGLMGAGRSEVLETIFGAQTTASGGQISGLRAGHPDPLPG